MTYSNEKDPKELSFGAPDSGEETSPSPSAEDYKPMGDFNVQRVKRKSQLDKKTLYIVAAMLGFSTLAIAGIITYTVLQITGSEASQSTGDIQADPALTTGTNVQDDSMNEMMAKVGAKTAAAKPTTDAHSPPPAADGQATATPPPTPPPRQQEAIFGVVSRFDSQGLSSGSVGGDSASSGDSNQDALIERIRQQAQGTAGTGGEASQNASLTGGTGRQSELDNLNGSTYANTKAWRIPDTKYLLKKRTNLECVLYTAIKTDHPGFTTCLLTRPIFSADGSTILAEAGAALYGEQRVEIEPGQTSAFTAFTELDVGIDGIRTSLNGLGTDTLGRSGIEAWVDQHMGLRIGSSLLVALWSDGLQTFSNKASSGGNSTYSYNNTEQASDELAKSVMDKYINITDTGYVLPGTVINVVVAQDIDFSSVFTTRRPQ